MIFKKLLTPLLIVTPLITFADADVTGKVLNKTTHEPMDFVNIQLLDASTGKQLPIGTSTDSEGKFLLPMVASGNYTVRISNLGSVDQERHLVVADSTVDVGVIQLADDSKLLQEVVVEGVRSQMRFELDKKVFTVDANIAAAGASASELLESIPSVEVDQDGEVSLRGNSSVTVWINGKESGLTADNRAQILEQIPAESIERVEVITNPSAKYNPEGTAGIINIILKKDRKAGYFGAAELGANSRGGGNASFNINVNTRKWEVFGSVGFRMRHNSGGSEMRRTFDNGNFLNSDGTSHNHGNNIFLRAGATYHINDNNSLYLNGFGMFGYRWSNSSTLYTQNLPGSWTSNIESSVTKSPNRGGHFEAGYTHKWDDNHTLDVSLNYNNFGGPNWHSYNHVYNPEYDNESSRAFDQDDISQSDIYREQQQDINFSSWEAKIDYMKVFNQYLKLEAGFNGNYGRENTPVWTKVGTNAANAIENTDLYNRFTYKNNVSALYFTLGGRVSNFSYSAGLRSEAWQVRTKSLGYGMADDSKDWYRHNNFALFPSVFLSYSLPHDNELQINWTRRIKRPRGGELNDFVDLSETANVSYGNPELKPEYANAFELNYIKSWDLHMLSASIYMRSADDVVNRLSYMVDETLYTTFGNVANRMNAGLELVGKNSLFKQRLDLTTTVNLYANHLSSWEYDMKDLFGGDVHLSGAARTSFAWDARMMANVRFPWALSLQVTGRYSSKQLSAQGSNSGGWSVDAGLRKMFGNWSVSLNCRDIFNSRKRTSTLDGIDYHQWSKRWRGGRTLQLTIKYSFGNMKGKKTPNAEMQEVDTGYDTL